MSDPVSLTASIAGIVTLAQYIISTSVTYFSSAHDRKCDFRSLVTELSHLVILLDGMKPLARRVDDSAMCPTSISHVQIQLQECSKTLIPPIADHLTKCIATAKFSHGKLMTTLKWPLTESETNKFSQRLEKWKSTFSIALHNVHLEMSVTTEERQKKEIESRMRGRTFKQIIKWLVAIECSSFHSDIARKKHPATGQWIFRDPRFVMWQQSTNSSLWIHGIPGAGKSVLISTVITELRKNLPSGHGLAYFYCVYNNKERRDPTVLLGSLVAQLCEQNQDFYKRVQDVYFLRNGPEIITTVPTFEELFNLLLDGSVNFTQMTLVIDALDECEDYRSDGRRQLLKSLEIMSSKAPGAISVLVTSRPERDICDRFNRIPTIPLEGPEVTKDIELYISSQLDMLINTKELRLGDESELRTRITDTLTLNAGGMFLYVQLQLEYLCSMLSDDEITMALGKLHPGIADVYVRIIKDLKNPRAAEILRYIAESIRPLTLTELAELFSIKEGQVAFRRQAVANDPASLARSCGSLVRVNTETQEVSLAHYSVKEFLASEEIKRSDVSEYYVSRPDVNKKLAKISLTYLLLNDFASGPVASKDALQQRVERYRFLSYAAAYVGEHIRMMSPDDEEIFELVQRFCSPPIDIERYTDDAEIRKHLSRMTFTCDLVDGFKYAPHSTVEAAKVICSFDINEIDDNSSPSEFQTMGSDTAKIELVTTLRQVLSGVTKNTTEKQNLLSWLQVARSNDWTAREHPANITPLYFASLVGWQAGVQKVLENTYSGKHKTDSDLNHALAAAAMTGQHNIITLLLDNGANIRAHTENIGSALQAASYSGNLESVKTLLQRGAHVEEPGNFYRPGGSVGSAVTASVSRSDKTMTKLLLKGNQHGPGNINNQKCFHGTPLAVYIRDPETVSFLLQNGADPTVPGGWPGSPLFAAEGDLLEQFIPYIRSPSDINRRIGAHGDAIQAAAFHNSADKVRRLLEIGGDPNAPCGQYGNAIQAAATRGDMEIVSVLLDNHADPNAPAEKIWVVGNKSIEYHGQYVLLSECRGYNSGSERAFFGPLMQAAIKGRQRRAILENEPTNQFNHYGNPLQAASVSGNLDTVRLLIAKGAKIDVTSGMYGNALQAAAVHGHTETVEFLLSKNACPNQRGGLYGTSLLGAATCGKWDIVDILIRNGADKNISDEHGWTARLCASHFHKRQLFPGAAMADNAPARPSEWSALFKSPKLKLDDENSEVTYCGEQDDDDLNLTAAVQANHPIPPGIPYYYFEIEIIHSGESGAVGLGISKEMTPLHAMPGWSPGSCGYHGDDGKLFSGGEVVGKINGFSTKDIVGCGVQWSKSICFFTVNGERQNETIQIDNTRLYPVVGMISKGGRIHMNFGDKPFKYDVGSLTL